MCAIKPAHHATVTFDVYTSDRKMTAREFRNLVHQHALNIEMQLNELQLRWHVQPIKINKIKTAK